LWWQRECIKIPRFLLASLAAVPHFLEPSRSGSMASHWHDAALAGCRKKIPSIAA